MVKWANYSHERPTCLMATGRTLKKLPKPWMVNGAQWAIWRAVTRMATSGWSIARAT